MRLSSRLSSLLHLSSFERTIIDHDPVIVHPAEEDSPVRRFKALFPVGAFEAPMSTWPKPQLAGYIAATCEITRMAFKTPEDWALRSGSMLAHLLFHANLDRLAVAYNLEGSKDGVAREVGTFDLQRLDTASAGASSNDASESDRAIGQLARADATAPAMKVNPLWADQEGVMALFDDVLAVLGDKTLGDPDHQKTVTSPPGATASQARDAV